MVVNGLVWVQGTELPLQTSSKCSSPLSHLSVRLHVCVDPYSSTSLGHTYLRVGL